MTKYEAVSVIGLGKMGTPIARSLLAEGRTVTVWNRTSAKGDDLVAEGASRASTLADAVAASGLIILVLKDHRSVMEMLEAAGDLLTGRAVVNLTTMHPEDAQAAARWASDRDVTYMQGAMMALPDTLGTPSAFFVYSGAEELQQVHAVLLSGIADSVYLGSDPSAASTYDGALLGVVYATLSGFLQSLVLAGSLDVPPRRFAEHAMTWAGGMIPYLGVMAGEIESSDYSDGASSVAMNRGAVQNILDTSTRMRASSEVLHPLARWLDQAVKDGGGEQSFASLIDVVRHERG